MTRRLATLIIPGAAAVVLAACGGEDPTQPARTPDTQPAAPVAPAAQAPAAPAAKPGASGLDPEREWEILEHCRRRAAAQCAEEQRDRGAYYRARQARIASSPFETRVDRVFLTGSCARGDDPLKRKDTGGLRAVVEGTLTYTGDDMLYLAQLGGAAFLRFGTDRHVEAEALDRDFGGPRGRARQVSRLEREVRGADPWIKGQQRPFHWESAALSEVFCEAVPDEAKASVEIVTRGIRGGRENHPLLLADLAWDEVLGMALEQQVQVALRQRNETVLEPAVAHFAHLDRILVTRLTGNTEWLQRTQVVQPREPGRAQGAAFPVQGSTSDWKITVAGIDDAAEFGGYAPSGEDQSMVVVELELANTGDEATSLKGLSVRLELAPGRWQGPVTKAVGQLDTAAAVDAGGSLAGRMAFVRQRFERPFRLEVRTPDKETVTLDVLSYDIVPRR